MSNSGTSFNNIFVANQGSGTATLELTAQNAAWAGASIQLNRFTTFQANYGGIGGGYLGNSDITSVISGSVGTLTVQALSTGAAYVTGNNTFVGTVVLHQGNVVTFHPGAFGGSGNSVIISGTAGLILYAADLAIGSLTGASGNTVNTSANGSKNLTISSANSATFAGVISGTGGIVKGSSGTQILSGTNTYTGVTTLTGGKLSVGTIGNGGVAGNLGAATNAAANLVFNGGTLQYTGATASTDRNFTLNTGTNPGGCSAWQQWHWSGSAPQLRRMRSRQSGRMARAVVLGGGGTVGGLGAGWFSSSVFSGGGRRGRPRLLLE